MPLMKLSEPLWKILKSSPSPNVALSLSAKLISLPLVCNSPPSCGDVSSTIFDKKPLTDALRAATSTPSTVPDTAILPLTDMPLLVVSNFETLLWYNSQFPSARKRANASPVYLLKLIWLERISRLPVPVSSI